MGLKPASADFKRRWAHACRMQAKQSRSPSRVLVAAALEKWRVKRGYPAGSNVYPGEVLDIQDLTQLVTWAKAQ